MIEDVLVIHADGTQTLEQREVAEIPDPEPTETERLRADVDFLLVMGGFAE